MPPTQISNDPAVIQFLTLIIGGCVGVINLFFFFILRGIKKNIDDLWTKRNEDHDDITRIKAKLE